ncbi:MAG: TRAP transporter TatT component family protein [Bryobacterales bacterium]
MWSTLALLACVVVALSAGSACSIRRYAINQVGDALADGPSVYETDEDVELVGEALPFGLKLVESLLVQSPNHRGLLLTASSGFVVYSYAYVDFRGEMIEDENLDRARQLRDRARKLYLRAHDYGLRGLELSYPGFRQQIFSDPAGAVQQIVNERAKQKHIELLYWSAASLGLAISISRNDAAMLARLPEVEALLDRALHLDEGWREGSLHAFKVQLAAATPGEPDYDVIKKHYERALQLSQGKDAGLYLAYAETVAVPRQNRAEFDALIEKALAVDVNAEPNRRLLNALAHRRAEWLRERADDLILTLEPESPGGVP